MILSPLVNNKPLVVLVSVSGGRTSCYMAKWMIDNKQFVADYLDIPADQLRYVFVFANTGLEHDDTLRFMRDVADKFSFECIWVEGYVTVGKKVSTQHRVVDFSTAYRWQQWKDPLHPYHNHCTKYGVSNVKWINCSREMKQYTITSYMKSIGLYEKRDYYTAIGIRADEQARKSSNPDRRGIIYPFIDIEPKTKNEVLNWWSQYDWDLRIPESLGNCITCYKKSDVKLREAYLLEPRAFEFNSHMEAAYGRTGPEFERDKEADARSFFRMKRNTELLIQSFSCLEGNTSKVAA